jgi:hypothetical protein
MDPKINFYWRNRARIEEWAALRSTAADLLIAELQAQADRLRELTTAVDLAVVGVHDPALIGLTRPSWAGEGVELQVGLSWTRSSLLAATGVNRPWVGVRVGNEDDRRRVLFDEVKRSAAAELRQLSWTNQASKNWPAWTYMEPSDDQDIALFARACGNEVIEGWKVLAPRLDEVVARVASASGSSRG